MHLIDAVTLSSTRVNCDVVLLDACRGFAPTQATDEPFFDGRAPDASAAYKQYVVGGRSLFGAADDVSTPYFIDVNPLRPNPTGWTASLVNDGATAAAGDEASAVSYYEASRARKNCALVPVGPAPLLAYATTRDVSAGDDQCANQPPSGNSDVIRIQATSSSRRTARSTGSRGWMRRRGSSTARARRRGTSTTSRRSWPRRTRRIFRNSSGCLARWQGGR